MTLDDYRKLALAAQMTGDGDADDLADAVLALCDRVESPPQVTGFCPICEATTKKTEALMRVLEAARRANVRHRCERLLMDGGDDHCTGCDLAAAIKAAREVVGR